MKSAPLRLTLFIHCVFTKPGKTQMSALADIIQAAMMLKYNERKVG